MPGIRIWGSRYLPFAASLWAIFAFSSGATRAAGQSSDKTPVTGVQNETPLRLKTTSNLVVVRVVVRDAQGKPVENLKKEDFKLFDRGKDQTITQFEVKNSVPPPSAVAVRAPGQAAPPPAPALPGKFIALYLDDLNTSDADMIQVRDAADHYLATNLHPTDRVAIFNSEQMLSDFTSDPKQIHDALFKLHASARALARAHYCPDLTDYQALAITQDDADALTLALDEEAHCGMSSLRRTPAVGSGSSNQPEFARIRGLARNIVNQAESLARTDLQELEQVVKFIWQMPGQRTMILASPGFLSPSEQYQLDRVIDDALRSQVVISALDPRGLTTLMRESDPTRSYIPTNANAIQAARRVDSMREFTATGVLAEIAQGTGGEYFHDSNDLKAGFGALAGSPTYYILTFAPAGMKHDGNFHALKVTLAEKEKGFTIQARRGYFAPKGGEIVPETVAEIPATLKAPEPKKESAPLDPEAQAEEQIREAVLSKTDVQQLPVALNGKLGAGEGDTRELSLSAHLDAAPLHFHKDGDHNLNTVTFVFAVFDRKENLVNARQWRDKVNVLDGQLPGFIKAGVDVNLTFQLKPGAYRLRAVVTDSEDHNMTALSRKVQIQ